MHIAIAKPRPLSPSWLATTILLFFIDFESYQRPALSRASQRIPNPSSWAVKSFKPLLSLLHGSTCPPFDPCPPSCRGLHPDKDSIVTARSGASLRRLPAHTSGRAPGHLGCAASPPSSRRNLWFIFFNASLFVSLWSHFVVFFFFCLLLCFRRLFKSALVLIFNAHFWTLMDHS